MSAPDLFGAGPGDYELTCTTTNLEPDIQPGDYLVVRPQDHAEAGQTVAILHEGAASLVRWTPETEGRVIGLVLGMFRSLR